MLPFVPDYRWLLDRDDSPWYPTARLFRQDKERNYAKVFVRVREELERAIAAFKPRDCIWRCNPTSPARGEVD